MIELKPCPFCGGKAFFSQLYLNANDTEESIACTDCSCVFTVDFLKPDRCDLAEAWNRRVEK